LDHTAIKWIERWIINCTGYWKTWIWPNLSYNVSVCLDRLRKTMKSCHISQSTDPDLNLRPSDYKRLIPTSRQYHAPHTSNQNEARGLLCQNSNHFNKCNFGEVHYDVRWVINGKHYISLEHLSNVKVINYFWTLKVS
jgi:hypothetical protein